MKKIMNSSLATLCLLVIVAAFSTTSCSSKNLGEGLTIGVTPGTAYIIPVGNVSSCTDLLSQPSGATTPVSQSISAPSMTFTNFSLNWAPTDEKLYVKAIRVTIEGQGIQGGKVSVYMPTDEISAMLKTPLVSGTTLLGYTGLNGEIDAQADIESNAAVKTNLLGTSPNQFSPASVGCGFTIGSISLASGDKTPSFEATITIEIIGVGVKTADLSQRVIIQTTTATADYIGIDQ